MLACTLHETGHARADFTFKCVSECVRDGGGASARSRLLAHGLVEFVLTGLDLPEPKVGIRVVFATRAVALFLNRRTVLGELANGVIQTSVLGIHGLDGLLVLELEVVELLLQNLVGRVGDSQTFVEVLVSILERRNRLCFDLSVTGGLVQRKIFLTCRSFRLGCFAWTR